MFLFLPFIQNNKNDDNSNGKNLIYLTKKKNYEIGPRDKVDEKKIHWKNDEPEKKLATKKLFIIIATYSRRRKKKSIIQSPSYHEKIHIHMDTQQMIIEK